MNHLSLHNLSVDTIQRLSESNPGLKFCRKAKKLLLTPDCEQYEHLTEEKWMVTLFLNESMLKRSWFSNMIFLQRSGVCDPIMHFIDNPMLHNFVLGASNQLICIETIPDSVMSQIDLNRTL